MHVTTGIRPAFTSTWLAALQQRVPSTRIYCLVRRYGEPGQQDMSYKSWFFARRDRPYLIHLHIRSSRRFRPKGLRPVCERI